MIHQGQNIDAKKSHSLFLAHKRTSGKQVEIFLGPLFEIYKK